MFLVELLAGEDRLVNVDNDDEIAAVDVRGEVSLVLAAQKLGSGDSRAAQGLAGCVENVPFSLDGLFLSHSGHVCFLRWKADAFYDKNFDKFKAHEYNKISKRASILYHTKKILSTAFFQK